MFSIKLFCLKWWSITNLTERSIVGNTNEQIFISWIDHNLIGWLNRLFDYKYPYGVILHLMQKLQTLKVYDWLPWSDVWSIGQYSVIMTSHISSHWSSVRLHRSLLYSANQKHDLKIPSIVNTGIWYDWWRCVYQTNTLPIIRCRLIKNRAIFLRIVDFVGL